MADITMCDDKECPRAHNCYRFTANANPYRQAYFMQSPRHGDGCPQFVDNGRPKPSPPLPNHPESQARANARKALKAVS